MLIILVLFTVFLCGNVQSARILGVFPMASHSHYKLGAALMMGLAEKGHDVTIISVYEEKNAPKNYRTIPLTGFEAEIENSQKGRNKFDMGGSNPFIMMTAVSVLTKFMDFVVKHENVQRLLKSDEKFDVVIVEEFFNAEHKAFATHFNAPLIVFCSVGANTWTNKAVGNPSPSAYVPHMMLEYSSQMTFKERLINVLFKFYNEVLDQFVFRPRQKAALQNYFPNPPALDDILNNASLVLLNSHPSINQPVPYVPSMIDVSGLHIKPPKALPKDLQEFLDGAKDGVVYFSMGSNLKSAELPPAKRDELLKAFSKLKQQVLWKWEDETLPGQPPNIKLAKWVPQNDVLAHPNVKLFITHGGYLSTTETIYHGVPVLAIPIYGDQKLNAKIAVTNGFGLTLPYLELSEERLTRAINELLHNADYKNNAKKRSALFHDRLVGPLDTATYWVEYVARHKGAPHLRVAGVDLPWWKYHLLDVIAFLTLVGLINLFIIRLIVKKVFRKICTKTSKKKTKTQ